ncbi:unnamed protein product, partial [marine sediment metagenome]
MSKRIFTKVFSGSVVCPTGVPVPQPAVQSWLVQEDIEVIGAEMAIYS